MNSAKIWMMTDLDRCYPDATLLITKKTLNINLLLKMFIYVISFSLSLFFIIKNCSRLLSLSLLYFFPPKVFYHLQLSSLMKMS